MAGIDRRLLHLVQQIYNDDDTQRNHAATVFYNYLKATDKSIGDMVLLDGEFADTWRETSERLKRLDRENDYLRRHVPPATLRKAALAGEVEYRWAELMEMAETRLGANSRSWRKQLADLCTVSVGTIQQWEEGIARIPYEVFDKLRLMPIKAAPRSARKPRRLGEPRRNYDWPESVLRAVVDAWLKGCNRAMLVEAAHAAGAQQVTPNMINGQIDNGKVPKYLQAAVRLDGEPIDWPELWLLGSTIFVDKQQRGWRRLSLRALGLNENLGPPADLNMGTTQARIDALRRKYVEHNLNMGKTVKPFYSDARQPILTLMSKVGPVGATRDDVQRELGIKYLRRINELQKSLDIFDTGRKRGTLDQVVYCSRQYWADHSVAWERACKTFGNMPDGQLLLAS